MPLVIAPAPPSPPSLSTCDGKIKASSPSRATSMTTEQQVHTASPPAEEAQSAIGQTTPRFPTATLEVSSISDVMAARLATCLLGHVLFLKSQVPFPVAQLLKMKSKKNESRANKKHDALLESFDLLSSHLGSTFSALTRALSSQPQLAVPTPATHLAIVLGPSATSPSAARARVVLELDGLRIASAGVKQNMPETGRFQLGENVNLKENSGIMKVAKADGERGLSVRPKGLGLQDISSRGLGLRGISCSDVWVEVAPSGPKGGELSEIGISQPAVGVLPRGLLNTSYSGIRVDAVSDDSDEEDDEDKLSESDIGSVPPKSDTESSSDLDEEETLSDMDDDGEEESDLLAAERLLSRTLAIANSDPEQGMAAEIRPTQTHILLRAPRCFTHPSWIPRQNLTRDMDPVLRAFDEPGPSTRTSSEQIENALNDITNGLPICSKSAPAKENAKKGLSLKGPGGIKTECVRVRCRNRDQTRTPARMPRTDNPMQNVLDEKEDEGNDVGSEMIWWSWDGKLEGFADW